MTGITLQLYLICQLAPIMEITLSACFYNKMYGH